MPVRSSRHLCSSRLRFFPVGRFARTGLAALLLASVGIISSPVRSTSRVILAGEREDRSREQTRRDARRLYLEGLKREAEASYADAAELYWESAVAGNAQAMLEWANALMTGQGVEQDENAALAWYRESAENGCPEAAMNLGWWYSRDLTDESRLKQAREWYRRAETLGFPSAHAALRALDEDLKASTFEKQDEGRPRKASEWLLNMTGKENKSADENDIASKPNADQREIDEALRQLREVAEAGDREAMTDLGLLYSRGDVVDQDEEEALRWWRRAAELGDGWAQHNLGWAYATGRGVERDLKAAFRSYFRAADQGNARALWEVGLAYLEGRGVKQDEAAAAHCFRRAAELGDPQAMAAMGQLSIKGSSAAGIDRDIDVACDWYLMAAAHGEDETAARTIAKLPESSFSRALRGDPSPSQEAVVEQDKKPRQTAEERLANLESRTERADVRAAILIGIAQLEGTGMDPNPEAAFKTFQKYAATEPDARAWLAQCYAEGAGVRVDVAKAGELLESAAAAGSAEAMFRMGRQLMRGLHPTYLEGLTWLQKAAAKGNANAMYELGLAWKEGRGVPRDDRQAIAWFLQAGTSDNPDAALEVARAFDQGTHLRQSPAKALAWYRHAARLGMKSAEERADEIVDESADVGAARAAIARAEIREGNILTDDVSASSSEHPEVKTASGSSDGDPEFRLGKAYREGRGVMQEPALAAFWLSRAVNKGHLEAHVELATLYADGTGTPQDKARAERLLKKAVEGNLPSAMYELASLYYGHDLRFRDRQQAMALFNTAAERGNVPAQRFLGKASRYGLATTCDGGEASRWWREAAENGDPSSMFSLGELCEEGFGVPHDLDDAGIWYRRALDNGVSEARTPLRRVQGQLRASRD